MSIQTQITEKELQTLVNMELLLHDLLTKHIAYEYNEEGEVIKPEWKLWYEYWSLIEKLLIEKEKNNE